MKFKALRGKNQFGYSFVSDPKLMLKSETVALRYGTQVVYTILRASPNVPSNAIIIDYRLFDELGCSENTKLEINSINDNIPMCGDIALSLASIAGLDNKKVAEAVSKRIEDLKPYFDGLIVRVGQIIEIPELKIKFVVTHLEPSAEFDRTARISWINLLRISIDPMKQPQCYNIMFLLDVGTAINKRDVPSENKESQINHESLKFKIMFHIIKKLFADIKQCDRTALFASIAFSENFSVFQTYDKTTGLKMDFSFIDASSLIEVHENWLMKQLESGLECISNPGNALERGLGLAEIIHDENKLPTIILICSEGAYSSGPNPVKLARMNSNPEIGIFCIALGNEADIEFLNAIANAGGGKMVHVSTTEDIELLPEILHRWITMRK